MRKLFYCLFIFMIIWRLLICKEEPSWDSEADFIVVGAGTAGSIVASRLATDDFSVTVIEAGDEPEKDVQLSRFYRQYIGSNIDWIYPTVPQQHAFQIKEGKMNISAGKVFGGSSTINAMLYMRGSKYDYDGWEEMGATKWSWNKIFSTMNDIEDAHLTGVNESLHHRDGPIAITNEGNDKPILNKFKQAIKNLGYGEADPNDGELSGVGPVQFNYYQNQRRSSYYEYLYTYHKATNPKIESSSIATRIIFDENSKAIGVEYVKDGVKKYAKARNEIVVCAGAIETPKLLMLSGIGPKAHLDELNINVIADRPVGKNLHDHVGVILPVFNKTGAGESGAVVAFLKSSESEIQSDIEMFSYLEGDFVFMGAILVKAESRGEIKLRSVDHNDKPVIDPQYLSEKNDRERLAKGVQTLFKIINEIDVTETGYEKMKLPPYPVCQHISKETLEYYECLVKMFSLSLYHPVGTARMGQADDSKAVVDPQLKVIDVEGLRVMDASVMPKIVSANTMVATMTIAERGFLMISSDHLSSKHS